ncbi:MAG: hypothetical protein QOK29_3693 [Rhodospirillaceae bacterium]|jgi:hypothetical protein|nr:hypothetical protein [Rhodospirillaceae bacterium]
MHMRSIRRIIFVALLPLAACGSTPKPAPAKPVAPVVTGGSVAPAIATAVAPKQEAPAALAIALIDPAKAPSAARAASAVIAARIAACWRAPAPADTPAVGIQLSLNRDGTVSTIEVMDKKRFAGDAGYRRAATMATRAFFQCAPFNLPAVDYTGWSSLSLLITSHHA